MPGFEPGASASRTLRANQTAPHPVRAVECSQALSRQPEPVSVRRAGPSGRPPQDAGVDRLHEHAVGVGPLGEEPVGLAVEEQQDLGRREPPLAGLEPQVDRARRCRPCWRSACRGSTRSGSYSRDRAAHVLARRTSTTSWSGPDERSRHLVPDPGGFGGDEDRGHGGATLLAPCRPSRSDRPAEQDLADLGERRRSRARRGRGTARRRRPRSRVRTRTVSMWPRSRSAISLKSARFS